VLSPPPSPQHPFFLQCALAKPGAAPFRTTPHLDGGGRGLRGLLWGAPDPILDGSPGLVRTGLGPARLFARLRNRPAAVRVDAIAGRLNYFFLDALGDFSPGTGLGWELWRDGVRAASGVFASAGGDGTGAAVEEIPVAPGPLELRVADDRWRLAGERGVARVTWRLDTRLASDDGSGDADPPDLVRFGVLDASGEPAEEIDPSAGGEVRFALADASAIRRVSLVATANGADVALPIEPEADELRASLASLPPGARVTLRLQSEDAAGNALELVLDPALRTTRPSGAPPAIASISPRSAGVAEAVDVAVSGSGFSASELRVTLGGVDVGARAADDSHLVFRAPSASASGPVDLVVETSAGRATAPGAFLEMDLPRGESCRLGDVAAARGSPAAVLGVDGGSGDGVAVRLDRGEAFSLAISPSPAGPEPAGFVLYAMAAQPSASTVSVLPWSIGTACLPLPLAGGASPSVRVLANSMGHRARLGRPLRESAPAPTSLAFRRGLRGPATLAVQGILEDLGSLGPGVSVTNAIVIWVP
jgi:IPT/TIG domain-containing protein